MGMHESKTFNISKCISGRLEHEYVAEKTTDGMKFVRSHRSSKEVLRHHTKVSTSFYQLKSILQGYTFMLNICV